MTVVVPLVILLTLLAIGAGIATGRRNVLAGREETSARALAQVGRRASQRLQLRRPVLDDLSFYVEMAADPVAAEANGWPESEVAMVKQRFAIPIVFDQLRRSEFIAVERSSNTPVSTVKFSPSPLGPTTARSIGIQVHPAHQNKGYGREVTAAAILLLQKSAEPIHIGTRTTNHGMQQIMRRLGYKPEPATRAYVAPNGDTYVSHWYHCGVDVHEPAGLYGE